MTVVVTLGIIRAIFTVVVATLFTTMDDVLKSTGLKLCEACSSSFYPVVLLTLVVLCVTVGCCDPSDGSEHEENRGRGG